jgi:ACS family tartrate transporter-like MFS transporter
MSISESAIETAVMRKVFWRIIAFCCLLLFFNYLDRVNIGFAAIQMNEDLGFTAAVYGFGAGIFFIGYALLEVPSNLILHKVGPRIWIARIMVTWGIISSCFAFISGPTSFYILRFLLGVAEAGFIPGILLYFTYWIPKQHRAKAYAGFFGATLLSNVIGAPLSGWIIGMGDQFDGLRGWQWMFLIEGIPSVILGCLVYALMRDRPDQASWLTSEEKQWLRVQLEDPNGALRTSHGSIGAFLGDPQVIKLTAMYFFNAVSVYGIVFWLPLLIKDIGASTMTMTPLKIGLVAAIPFFCGFVVMQILGRTSDRTGDRKWHVAGALLAGAVGLAGSGLVSSPVVAFCFICVAAMGIWGALGVFWALPATYLTGVAAAGGLAFINSLAQVGGFFGPNVIGMLKDSSGGYTVPLLVLAASALLVSIIASTLRDDGERSRSSVRAGLDASSTAQS